MYILIAIFSSMGVSFHSNDFGCKESTFLLKICIVHRCKVKMKRFATLILAILLLKIYFISGLPASVDSLQEALMKNESEEAGI